MVKITSTRWLLLLGASIILGLMLFGLFHEVTILSEGGVEILSTIKIQRNGTFEQLQASNFIHEFESEPVSWNSERLVLFNFTLTPEPEMPRGMSSIECDDGDCCSSIFINRSCVYSNLYYPGMSTRLQSQGHRKRARILASGTPHFASETSTSIARDAGCKSTAKSLERGTTLWLHMEWLWEWGEMGCVGDFKFLMRVRLSSKKERCLHDLWSCLVSF